MTDMDKVIMRNIRTHILVGNGTMTVQFIVLILTGVSEYTTPLSPAGEDRGKVVPVL
jgi:hypothetical protein